MKAISKKYGNFGEVIHVELVIDRAVNIPKGHVYVEFKARADAEKAQLFMDGVCLFPYMKCTMLCSPLRRSPIRRPSRSRSRRRAPADRRGRSSSYSCSPSPRRVPKKISRSRSPKR